MRALSAELLVHSRFYLHTFADVEMRAPELAGCGLSLYALSVYARLEVHASRTLNHSDADVEVFAPYSLVDEVMYPCMRLAASHLCPLSARTRTDDLRLLARRWARLGQELGTPFSK
jgi:hypothetical protein